MTGARSASTGHWFALGALLGALVAWDAGAGVLPDRGEAIDVVVVVALLIPATFGVVWLLLPYATERGVLPVAIALAVLAVVLHVAGLDALFNVTKLLALTGIGFVFLQLFEALSWVVLVAVIVPWVDAASVWRGPTDYVVSEQPGLFDRISYAFRVPGEEASANIGPPDILFFALFLATADRFGLRVGWTWVAMTGLLGATLVLTASFDIAGLPALPAVALGFLIPNADLVWRSLRTSGEMPDASRRG
jgi:hypothetical protein